MSGPMTTLTTVTPSGGEDGELDGGHRLAVGDGRPEDVPAAVDGGDDHGDQGDQDQRAEPDHGDAEPEPRRPRERGARARPARSPRRSDACDLGGGHVEGRAAHSSERPAPRMASKIRPFSSSKNFVDTSSQPPKSSSTVSSVGTSGNGFGRVGRTLDGAAVVDVVADRAEAGQGELLLALVGEDEVQPGLRRRGGVLEDGAGVLDEQRGVRDDVLEALVVLARRGWPRSRRPSARRRCRRGRPWWRHGRCSAARRRS